MLPKREEFLIINKLGLIKYSVCFLYLLILIHASKAQNHDSSNTQNLDSSNTQNPDPSNTQSHDSSKTQDHDFPQHRKTARRSFAFPQRDLFQEGVLKNALERQLRERVEDADFEPFDPSGRKAKSRVEDSDLKDLNPEGRNEESRVEDSELELDGRETTSRVEDSDSDPSGRKAKSRWLEDPDLQKGDRELESLPVPLHGPLKPPVPPYSLDWVREGRMRADEISQRIKRQFGRGEELLNTVTEYGINETNYLIRIHEPTLFTEGFQLESGHPGLHLAAFNKLKPDSMALSRFGYAALKASQRLSSQFQLSRQEALFGLEQVSTENTPLFSACPFKTDEETPFRRPCPAYSVMYRTLDGSCNNADHPEWGAALRPFARFLPPDYSDGIEAIRDSVQGESLPNVRRVSTTVHRPLNRPSKRLSMMVMQWGQFLDHDLTATAQSRGFNNSVPRCCDELRGKPLPEDLRHPDCLPITIAQSDPFYSTWNQSCMEFLRSSPAPRPNCGLGPRDQINQVTAYLDASNVYGSDDHEMAQLRLWEGGMLRYKPVRFRKPLLPALHDFEDGECRENSRNLHCFAAGDIRVNEQPGLASMHTVWLREHNRLVTELSDINPHWNDDRLFFEARKIVAASMQKITYGEWLPHVLGPAVMKVFRLPLQRRGYYRGYKSSVNPTITNSVATAAFRFGHSLVQRSLPRCDKTGRRFPFTIKLHQELMNPSNIHNFGSVDRLMFGLAFEKSQSRDVYMTDELTKRLFQTPTNHFGLDLASINIQRGREHGLPAYNIWREQCGLQKFANWGELLGVMDDDTVGRLASVYQHVNDVDLFTGGLAEKPVVYGLVGPTFACILGQQFLNLRRGDRFWFENGGMVSSFTIQQLDAIRNASLAKVLCNNLDDVDTMQPNVFRLPTNPEDLHNRNPMIDCSDIPSIDLLHWKENLDSDFHGFHYSGSPVDLIDVQGDESSSTPEQPEKEEQEEEPIDYANLKESEIYFLQDEEQLEEEEQETLKSNGFASELPEPFIVVPGDEPATTENGKENTGPIKENDGWADHSTLLDYNIKLRKVIKTAQKESKPVKTEPGISKLTDHNYNNVVEHAYANTLFYRRST